MSQPEAQGAAAAAGAPPQQQPVLTRVNGIGMWNSWTRNFKTPLLALFDLLDNCFDAALKPLKESPSSEEGGPGDGPAGREADEIDGEPMSDDDDDDDDEVNGSKRPSSPPLAASGATDSYSGAIHIEPDKFCPPSGTAERTTGICLINNSFRPIKSIEKILEVYSSAKGRDKHGEGGFAETIGENGVGLKQGCATLSDLSFVLTRNGERLSLGVVAERLQREEGIYLPSFHFQSEEESQLRREMERLFGAQYLTTVGECVKDYGEGSMSAGISRLVGHFGRMKAQGTWGKNKHVFCVVLHKLKHGSRAKRAAPATSKQDDDATLANRAGPSSGTRHAVEADADPLAVEAIESANLLMRELKDELPHNYIHIPDDFEVMVDSNAIDFCFWQRRLVEMSAFYNEIDENTSYILQSDDWKRPKNGYTIRVLCGFDPTRAKGDKNPSLLIYSRQSGRLIKTDHDCRAALGLPAGGSQFTQGLTVIVDDLRGNLPLSPTKQDVAFGEQANGSVHKKNLYAWVSAIAHFFYQYQLRKYAGSKTILSEKLKYFGSKLPADASDVRPIDSSEFTTFEGIPWYVTPTGSIRNKSYKNSRELQGKDTLWRLEASPDSLTPSSKPRGAKKRKMDDTQDDNAVPVHCLQLEKRARNNAVDYYEGDDDVGISSQEDDGVGEATLHDLETPDAGLQLAVAQGFRSQDRSPARSTEPSSAAEKVTKLTHERDRLKSTLISLESAYGEQRRACEEQTRKCEDQKQKKKYYKGWVKGVVSEKNKLEVEVSRLKKELEQQGHLPDGVRELELNDNINRLTEALTAKEESLETLQDEFRASIAREKQLEERFTHLEASRQKVVEDLNTEKKKVAELSRKLTAYPEQSKATKIGPVVDIDKEVRKLRSELNYERKRRKLAEAEKESVEAERDICKEQNQIFEERLSQLSTGGDSAGSDD